MDISKQNGKKKHLPVIFYTFIITAGINITVLVYWFFSNIVFEWTNGLMPLLFCVFLCILELLFILFMLMYYLITKKKIYGFLHMIFIGTALFLSTIIFLFLPLHNWSDKKKQKLLAECQQTESVDDLSVSFFCFSSSEMERVLVRQIHKGVIIDTFYIQPTILRNDSTRYYSNISPVYISDTYQFVVSKQTFTLSELKLGLKPQISMSSTKYKCIVTGYKVNNSIFQNKTIVEIKK